MDIIRSLIVWITGISFMAVTFPLNFIVWFLTLPFDRDRTVIHMLLVHQAYLLTHLLPLWKIEFSGLGKADRRTTYVIISNHQSLLDILFINCLRLRFKWVSKIENCKVPVLGWYLRMADYIIVDRGNDESKEAMLARSLSFLKKGISVTLFPEGTRSTDLRVGFFKRGAFQLAIESQVPILPVVLDGTGGVLPKHGFIFGAGHTIKVKVLDPVYPESFGTASAEELASGMGSMISRELEQLRNNVRAL